MEQALHHQIGPEGLVWGEGGLLPVIVQDVATREVLMLAYMNRESLRFTMEKGEVWLWSRSRKSLWHKGEGGGNTQRVVEIRVDCDSDALLVLVHPQGPACHTGERSCFYRTLGSPATANQPTEEERGSASETLATLTATIADRKAHPREGSYTNKLLAGGTAEMLKKVGEEAAEVVVAGALEGRERLVYESADLVYHLLVLLASQELTWADVEAELARRFK
jgi:phosphoribosyl-ATP pyrophosphohydrolase/phosphoribosyl-AMP cyclohydrolase